MHLLIVFRDWLDVVIPALLLTCQLSVLKLQQTLAVPLLVALRAKILAHKGAMVGARQL